MKQYFDKLYTKGFDELINNLEKNILTDEKAFVITANPETLMLGTEILEFDSILKSEMTTIVPDGIGIVKAAKILGYPIRERIAGIELAQRLLKFLDMNGRSLFLFGAEDEVLQKLVCKIQKEYSRINLLGYQNGFVEDKDLVLQNILKLQPDVVLVALGIPMQELLIARYYNKFSKGIFMGVGGAFDVLSDTKKRAPQVFIDFNLEWLYRITSEPKRIKRFLHSNVRFVAKVMKIRCTDLRNTKER